MPLIKEKDIVMQDIIMDGIKGVKKAVVIGQKQGWDNYVLRLFRLQPGGYTPKHQHNWEHVNYITKGKGKLYLDGEEFELMMGDFAFIPANVEHQFQNNFDEDFEFICIVPRRGESQ